MQVKASWYSTLAMYFTQCGGPKLTPEEKEYRSPSGNRSQCLVKHIPQILQYLNLTWRLNLLSFSCSPLIKASPSCPCCLGNAWEAEGRLEQGLALCPCAPAVHASSNAAPLPGPSAAASNPRQGLRGFLSYHTHRMTLLFLAPECTGGDLRVVRWSGLGWDGGTLQEVVPVRLHTGTACFQNPPLHTTSSPDNLCAH